MKSPLGVSGRATASLCPVAAMGDFVPACAVSADGRAVAVLIKHDHVLYLGARAAVCPVWGRCTLGGYELRSRRSTCASASMPAWHGCVPLHVPLAGGWPAPRAAGRAADARAGRDERPRTAGGALSGPAGRRLCPRRECGRQRLCGRPRRLPAPACGLHPLPAVVRHALHGPQPGRVRPRRRAAPHPPLPARHGLPARCAAPCTQQASSPASTPSPPCPTATAATLRRSRRLPSAAAERETRGPSRSTLRGATRTATSASCAETCRTRPPPPPAPSAPSAALIPTPTRSRPWTS